MAENKPAIKNFYYDLEKFLYESRIDLIVCVASGGFEPSFAVGMLLPGVDLITVRFSRYKNLDKRVLVPRCLGADYATQRFSARRVLIVDDAISSGFMMEKTMEFISSNHAEVVYGAAVEAIGSSGMLKPQLRVHKRAYETDIYIH